MAHRNPFNFLKGQVAKAGFVGTGFARKILKALSEDRIYLGKGLKETPGQDGRMIELDGEPPSVVCPWQVEWDKKELKVKHNGGSCAYMREDSGELVTWRPRESELKFAQTSDCYVFIRYTHRNKEFEVMVSTNPPDHWESDATGKPTRSSVIIARILDKELRQETFSSFIISPFFNGRRAVLEFTCYPTLP